MSVRRRVIVEVPSRLGLRTDGVERLPEALLAAGLADRIVAIRGARVTTPTYEAGIDPGTGILNAFGLRDYAVGLADVVAAVLETGAIPVVLGGDCSTPAGWGISSRRFWGVSHRR